jgi:hypothetical protein
MRLRWIIVAGAVGLMIAWREASLVAVYVAMIGCMILYGLRAIRVQLQKERDSLQLYEERDDQGEFDAE